MNEPSADWAGRLVSWCSTICARACWSPTFTIPALNPLYRDVLAQYGAVAMPCRICKIPDRKGKVRGRRRPRAENPVLKRSSLRESGRSAQAYLDRCGRTLGRHAHPRAPPNAKSRPCSPRRNRSYCRFPYEPFRYYQYGERIVHLDGCVEIEAAYYGAPPGWIGHLLRVQWDELFVRLLDPKTGQLLREHVRQKRGWYRIQPEDQSKRTPLRTSQLLWRAGRAGTHIGALCEAIHHQQGEVGVRRTPRRSLLSQDQVRRGCGR